MSIFTRNTYTALNGTVYDLPIGVRIRKGFKNHLDVGVTIGGTLHLLRIADYLNIDHAVQAGINLLRDKILEGAYPGHYHQKKNATSKYDIDEVGITLTKSQGRYKGRSSTLAHALHITYPDVIADKTSRLTIYLGTQCTWEANYPPRLQKAISFRQSRMTEYVEAFLAKLPTIIHFPLKSKTGLQEDL